MKNFWITVKGNIVQTLYLYPKKVINKTENTIIQSRFFQSVIGLEDKLISTKQSGFKPGNSCVNQFLSITFDIFTSFNKGLEVRCIFLDISQAFN